MLIRTTLVPIDVDHKNWKANALKDVVGANDDRVRIVLLYVARELPSYVISSLPHELLRENRKKIQAELEEFAKQSGDNFFVEIRQGNPATAILDEAERLQADLIVINSHSPGLTDYFIGSTASRVVRHAKCSVLVSR